MGPLYMAPRRSCTVRRGAFASRRREAHAGRAPRTLGEAVQRRGLRALLPPPLMVGRPRGDCSPPRRGCGLHGSRPAKSSEDEGDCQSQGVEGEDEDEDKGACQSQGVELALENPASCGGVPLSGKRYGVSHTPPGPGANPSTCMDSKLSWKFARARAAVDAGGGARGLCSAVATCVGPGPRGALVGAGGGAPALLAAAGSGSLWPGLAAAVSSSSSMRRSSSAMRCSALCRRRMMLAYQ